MLPFLYLVFRLRYSAISLRKGKETSYRMVENLCQLYISWRTYIYTIQRTQQENLTKQEKSL